MLISEAFERYRTDFIIQKGLSDATAENYKQTLASMQKALPIMHLEDMTYDHIKKWHNWMIDMGISASSRRGYLSRTKNLLRYYNRVHLINFDIDLFELPKEPKRKPKYVTPREVRAMIDQAACLRDQCIIALLFSTGIRVSELIRLNRRDIDGNRIEVMGKGKVERTAVVDPKTLQRLQEYLETRSDRLQPLFLTCRKDRIKKERVEGIVRTAGELAGIHRVVTPHVLRHSHATDLLSNGADIRYIQHSLGHADISTTMIYTHVIDKDYERVYSQFHTVV
jgi:site-specific recombinase XerD